MNKQTAAVTLTLTESLLATASGNPNLHEEYIAANADTPEKLAEEVASVTPNTPALLQAQIEKASTIFPKDERGLFLWDYQIKGFFKEAIGALAELGNTGAITKWTFKKIVDDFLHITPRRIYLLAPGGAPITTPSGVCQRPLRASTMQGDRVALARSETVAAGSTLNFVLTLLVSTNAKSKSTSLTMDLMQEALEFGKLKGLGQWRNSGMGRFSYVIQ